MMRNESDKILDDLLVRWHHWARGWCNSASTASSNFRDARTSRQYETAGEVIDETLETSAIKSMAFQIGEMKDPHRTAIHFEARNLATGVSVWTSPRLPRDLYELSIVVQEARNQLLRRLVTVGVV